MINEGCEQGIAKRKDPEGKRLLWGVAIQEGDKGVMERGMTKWKRKEKTLEGRSREDRMMTGRTGMSDEGDLHQGLIKR